MDIENINQEITKIIKNAKSDMQKNRDLNFIKKFNKITIKHICEENGITPSNLWTGRCSKEKVTIVRKAIESKIAEIRIEEFKEYSGE